MADLRCNVCNEIVRADLVTQHVAGRNHSIKKKVAQYNEMNAQIKPSYRNDIPVARVWIRDLYEFDCLSGSGDSSQNASDQA
jgi:hypothetical protein